jgi:hypothetical protein
MLSVRHDPEPFADVGSLIVPGESRSGLISACGGTGSA